MRNILKALSTLFILLCSIQGYGQLSVDTSKVKKEESEIAPIATDRPDQTETPLLTPVKHFQIETGAWFETDRNKDDLVQENLTFNTTLFKYGVSEHFELRLISEFVGEYGRQHNTDSIVARNVGVNSFAFGTKIFICEQRGIIPKTSLIAHLQLPYFGNKSFRPNHLAPRFRFTMMNVINDRFSLSYNLGAEWYGNTSSATGIYTVSLAVALVNRLGMFVEAYGFVTERSDPNDVFNGKFDNDHRFDAGFTYLLNNNLQADISGGIGLSEDSPDTFLSCGISWRFKVAKDK